MGRALELGLWECFHGLSCQAEIFLGGNLEVDRRAGDYGDGMTNFCKGCHNGPGWDNTMHKANVVLRSSEIANYNNYVIATTAGDHTGYTALVPFERGAAATLAAGNSDPADTSSKVMCLSCHRAHFSPFKNAFRWDYEATLMDEGRAENVQTKAYYGRDFTGTHQRNLCNKCHNQG